MWFTMDTSTSQSDGFLNESISQIKGNKTKTNGTQKLDCIIPTMIGHIIHFAKNRTDKLCFYGLPVRIITFMGIVCHIEQSTTKITFEIKDETGDVTGVKLLERDKESAEACIQINTYVRVHGMIRDNNNKQYILILGIVPIEELNELTNHLLEVTYVILEAKEMTKPEVEMKEEDNTSSNLTHDQLIIYKIVLAENDTDCGIERSMVQERAPPNLKSHTNRLLDFLIQSGYIYTTFTNDHFKTI